MGDAPEAKPEIQAAITALATHWSGRTPLSPAGAFWVPYVFTEEIDAQTAALAERDATIAALRAEVADLLPMLDAGGMTISNQQAEIDRLRAGIDAAVEGRYDRSDCGFRHIGTTGDCPTCLRAHLRAMLDPPAPDGGEER